jgi:formylglycine-generating enzyme
MALVPGGSVAVGAKPASTPVAAFCLDAKPTSVADYRACVAAGHCKEPHDSRWCNWSQPDRTDHPMNCVTWDDATAYCADRGARLPSEAERVWAAKGASPTNDFPWGAAPVNGRACWSGPGTSPRGGSPGEHGRESTCPIGAFPDGNSPQGLTDLVGNVSEWTSSRDTPEVQDRVAVGGQFDESDPTALHANRRAATSPWLWRGFIGFRCARDR